MEIIASVNLLAGAAALSDADPVDAGHVANDRKGVKKVVNHCTGDLRIENICDPVCDQIFSHTSDKEKAAAEAKRMFTETIECDSVCTCICEAICDKFI